MQQEEKSWLGHDRLAEGGQRSVIMQDGGRPASLDTKFFPKLGQIHRMRCVLHLRIQFLQNRNANGAIARLKRALQTPIFPDRTTRLQDPAERFLETFCVLGPPSDFDIRQQTKKRAAPVGSSPGRRMIETAIAGLGQALRQITHYVGPRLRRAQIAAAHTSDRLDVGREPFLDPMVFVRHAGKSEMHHLVRHQPVGMEMRSRRLTTHRNSDDAAIVDAKSFSGIDPVT